MSRPLRAYLVTHFAKAQLYEVVAARSVREAIEKAEDQRDVIDDWAGETFPMTRPVARRYPALDAEAALVEEAD